MSVRSALEEQSQQNADSFALLSLDRKPLTYARLVTHSYRIVAELNHTGIRKHGSVGIPGRTYVRIIDENGDLLAVPR